MRETKLKMYIVDLPTCLSYSYSSFQYINCLRRNKPFRRCRTLFSHAELQEVVNQLIDGLNVNYLNVRRSERLQTS